LSVSQRFQQIDDLLLAPAGHFIEPPQIGVELGPHTRILNIFPRSFRSRVSGVAQQAVAG